jgi:AcrR family transcriptional regulator
MGKKIHTLPARDGALSRQRIIDASIALLDQGGEGGLTFRALSEQLATGPGAIYWHIANKGELLSAACDTIIAHMLNTPLPCVTPQDTLRAVALGMFDTIDAHPWVGAALTRTPGGLPMVRIFERIGQQVRALRVPEDKQWETASALLSYILGVSGQNAANAQIAQARSLDRFEVLGSVSATWSSLDEDAFPFTRSVAGQLQDHDDRVDFLAGINLLLKGIENTCQ